MDCILNHCHDGADGDWILIVYYAVAVSCMLVSALFSKSKMIRSAALLITAAWAFSLFAMLYIGGAAYLYVAVMINCVLAWRFFRLAQRDLFPIVLLLIVICENLFLGFAIATSFDWWWTIFTLNRLFELMLLYIIGSSLFRMRVLKSVDENRKPPRGWRAQFAAI